MEQKKKFLSGQAIANIILFVGVAATIFGILEQGNRIEKQNKKFYEQNRKIDSINYQIYALEFLPRLKIIGEPFISSIEGELDYGKLEEHMKINDNTNYSLKDSITLDASMTSVLKFKNIGNSLAKLKFSVAKDFFTGSDILRKELSRDLEGRGIQIEYLSEYFKTELVTGESIEIGFQGSLYSVDSLGIKEVHYLLLYENEMGVIFDTYIWVQYYNIPTGMEFKMKFKFDSIIHPNEFYYKYFMDSTKNISAQIIKSSYKIYNRKETEKMRVFIDSLYTVN